VATGCGPCIFTAVNRANAEELEDKEEQLDRNAGSANCRAPSLWLVEPEALNRVCSVYLPFRL
jgi:hypothetical protein